jgi:acetyl-CoA carboxylase carboxyl transferase subunit alpha
MGNYLDFEKPIEELELKIHELRRLSDGDDIDTQNEIERLENKADALRTEIFSKLTRWQVTQIARHPDRPYTLDYIAALSTDFVELHGDRAFSDDQAIVGGFASIDGVSVMIIGHQKGRGVKERIRRNFGQPHPEGYRKALRLMKLAERFSIPVVTLIDTPGAYPGIGAEERGQGEAIATNLMGMSRLRVPIVSVVIGEGGSGGALALGVTDRLYMLEHSTYSVISPEGCASILWSRNGTTLGSQSFAKAADALKLTARDLSEFGIIHGIIPEPLGGAHRDIQKTAENIKATVLATITEVGSLNAEELVAARYEGLRKLGRFIEEVAVTRMTDILRITASFALMVVLLRLKLRIGHVMLIGALSMGAMYLMGPGEAWRALAGTLNNRVTVELVLALSFIRMLEMVLREQGLLKRMMESFKGSIRSRRLVIISMPLLIGMLPSVGGAYFSAPMVEEASEGEPMGADEKAFVNYWFRHPWEFVLPLYPGILLASALGGIELRTLMILNLVPGAVMITLGFLFSMRKIEHSGGGGKMPDLRSFLPIGFVLILVIALGVKLYIALAVVVGGIALRYRYGPARLWKLLRHGFSLDVAVLIFGVMLFKETMEITGAVANISLFFTEAGVPLLPTLVLLPFMAGILTGITVGYVGATFPLIASLAGGGTPEALALAFAAGLVGVLLSPVHVCLILTREYFCADMGGVYRRMYLPALAVLVSAIGLYLAIS